MLIRGSVGVMFYIFFSQFSSRPSFHRLILLSKEGRQLDRARKLKYTASKRSQFFAEKEPLFTFSSCLHSLFNKGLVSSELSVLYLLLLKLCSS